LEKESTTTPDNELSAPGYFRGKKARHSRRKSQHVHDSMKNFYRCGDVGVRSRGKIGISWGTIHSIPALDKNRRPIEDLLPGYKLLPQKFRRGEY